MATSIPFELAKFYKNCKYLRNILKQTQIALEEIRVSGKFYAEHLASADFTREEIDKINQVIEQPPYFIIFGQNSYSKACVLNELFSQPILPLVPETQTKSNWRTICFQYGVCSQISLMLPDSYELATPLAAHDKPWKTIPLEDLEVRENLKDDPAHTSAILEVNMRYVLLKDEVKVVVSPSEFVSGLEDFVDKFSTDIVPIVIYTIANDHFSDDELSELREMKLLLPGVPIFFIRTPPSPSEELTESEQHTQLKLMETRSETRTTSRPGLNGPRRENDLAMFQSLCDIGYLSMLPARSQMKPKRNFRRDSAEMPFDSIFAETFESFPDIVLFVRQALNTRIICATEILREGHSRCLRMFILSAFDMTRDMIITPKRLDYAKVKELELFTTLTNVADNKQEEIKQLIVKSIANMKEELLEKAAAHEFIGVKVSETGEIKSSSELKICTGEIQDLVLGKLNTEVASKLIDSVEYLKESFVGTLQRCLQSLENAFLDEAESPQANAALTQILNAAYQVEITSKTSSSFMRALWEKMKQLVQTMPWKTPPRIDVEWKKKVAADMMNRLNETRLSRSICAQFREKLKQSHETFTLSLRQLEAHHNGRLERTEERRLKVRKQLAPRLARYALESTSLQDMLLYGMPQLGKEIGRGQYGVVYSCKSWGGNSPCALKSVVPPDEKHWNDLAMEFYYTRSVPEHDHVVAIRGSVIDYSYGGGSTPAVLLIMDELQRDLHTAIKTGLEWLGRLQVAIDVVQGIRFLHSQGLIHRDIKLKNVLLDKRNRGKVTDLGFCKPEAMMSGSIVGTPIHMAPELFTGRYDNTVDIYAFGILFWYICAGHVRLPYVYEQCQNKDSLWSAVKKGCRPERLPQFNDTCWALMEECWAGDPIVRPLLGDVENRLRMIREHYRDLPPPGTEFLQREVGFGVLSTSAYIDVDYCPPI